MAGSPEVAVVGGGVIGCAIAWYLARAGVKVELYERGALGGEATAASAGILAPLAESVTPGPFAQLALAGLHAFNEDIEALKQESGLDPEYRRCGVLRLAMDGSGAAGLQAAATWQANAKLDMRWLEPRQVASLEPGLAACAGALLSPQEGHVSPTRLTATLASAATRSGAVIHQHSAAPLPWVDNGHMRGLRIGDEERPAGQVILAAGAWSGAWAEAIGVRVPVRPVKGQMLLLRTVSPPVRQVIFADHTYLVPRADGTIYVGATQEEAGFDRRVTAAGLHELAGAAADIAPALRDAEFVQAGAGLRPGIIDNLPVIGSAPGVDGLLVAAGHFRNGILMSLVTGRVVSALAQGRPPELDVTPYSPSRFGGVGGQGSGVGEGAPA
jgi:glycine oxidase